LDLPPALPNGDILRAVAQRICSTWHCWTKRSLELEAAIRASAVAQRGRRAARRAGVAAEIDIDLGERTELGAQELAEGRQVGLLNQEVRARTSTFAGGAFGTPDDRGNPVREAARP
jgi:hypothetical protein